ncbi:hypothetical protein SAMN02745218_01156 [Desulfofundulus australicus DSM 11792]|uniref:ASCH domain-containing protein n=1 Tax=Desulfofundulus australicus DSM 11792 TaxID=1121425 RepID=A0A1M4XT31_9FIRM|nr:hypothetical protein SAMN02745218_01156 [Desulfofundulus australicus DSM 11792]
MSYRAESLAHVWVIAVRRERLGNIPEGDIRNQGYSSVKAYREAFERDIQLLGPGCRMWVVEFELARQF